MKAQKRSERTRATTACASSTSRAMGRVRPATASSAVSRACGIDPPRGVCLEGWPTGGIDMRLGTTLLIAALLAVSAPLARAHVELGATLDAKQETPTPTGVPTGAAGTASFVFTDEDGMMT